MLRETTNQHHPIRRHGLVAAVIGLLAGCGGGGSDDGSYLTTMQVDTNRTVCTFQSEQLCYNTRADESQAWTARYPSIGGLSYEWGRRYTLRVRVTPSGQVTIPEDLSGTLTVVEVLSVSAPVPASTVFSMIVMNPARDWRLGTDGRWRLMGLPMDCEPLACQQLQQLASSAYAVSMQFDHRNSPGGPLHLLSVGQLLP